jgi:hypothetical protein
MRSRGAALCLLLALPLPGLAADSVWISRGSSRGQGTMVVLGEHCLALTAGHVVSGNKEPITLVDAARNSAAAVVVAVDARSDLALLEVPDPRAAGRALCTRTPRSIPVWSRAEALAMAGSLPSVWLDKVNSASGELFRFDLRLLPRQLPDRLHLGRSPARFGQRDPEPGDSGAPVWMSTTLTAERRYAPDGKPRPAAAGARLLGLYVGRQNEDSVLVPGDVVRSFVLQTVERIDASQMAISPAGVRIVRAERGKFPRPGRGVGLEIDATALRTLSLELDLGNRETTISGVTLLAERPGAVSRRSTLRFAVESSAYRPDRAVAWASERCLPDRARGSNSLRGEVVRCEFSSPKVSRGLRLEFDGALSSIRAVEIHTQ